MIPVGIRHAPLWRQLYRWGLLKPSMPQWRVVVEGARAAPSARQGVVVAGVLVWAPDAEEAEALARMAVEAEGYETTTADAVRVAPQSRPMREACAVARTPFAFLSGQSGMAHVPKREQHP